MEKDFSRGHLEELLKERTEEYNMYPTERVWNGIYHRLHTRRKWHFIGGGTFALMIMAGVFLLIQDNTRPASKTSAPAALYAKNGSGAGENDPISGEPPSLSPGTLSLNGQVSLPNDKLHAFAQPGNDLGNDNYGLAAHLDPRLSPLGQYMENTPADEGGASDKNTYENTGRETASTGGATDNEPSTGSLSSDGIASLTTDNDHIMHLRMTQNAPLLTASLAENVSALSAAQKTLAPSRPLSRFSWLFHFEPSVSFRTLKSKGSLRTGVGLIVVGNNGYDINQLVEQRPSVGFEIGTDFLYSLTSRLRLKAGLQFNYSRYTAQVYNTETPQPVLITLGGPGTGGIPSTTVSGSSQYQNEPGTHKIYDTWIPDQRAELSLPVGAEFRIMHNQTVSWNVAGSFQPSYILNAKAFLLSQDYKDYVQDPNLLRRWNMNVAAETFVRINKGKVQLQLGPQVRYQLQPSFISSYPIKEHLYDIGFKIGITQNIR
jgi:hypothetical protein